MLNDCRNTYDNLKLSYEHFGQFQYSDQRDQGEIKTDVYAGDWVWVESKIEEGFRSLSRFIVVNKEGIVEGELSNWSEFK